MIRINKGDLHTDLPAWETAMLLLRAYGTMVQEHLKTLDSDRRRDEFIELLTRSHEQLLHSFSLTDTKEHALKQTKQTKDQLLQKEIDKENRRIMREYNKLLAADPEELDMRRQDVEQYVDNLKARISKQ